MPTSKLFYGHKYLAILLCLAPLSILCGCGSNTIPNFQLTVQGTGTGKGTVTSNPSGISCGTTCGSSFASGTSVTLTATPSTGSTFAGWSGACSGPGTCAVALKADASVTAAFNVIPVQLTVQSAGTGTGTVTSNPSGINCGTTCSASFAIGTSVTLTAAPNTGSTFAGWSGACSGTGTCAVTLTASTSITATFNVPTVQLTVQRAGTGTGTVASSPSGISCGATCNAGFASGTSITLTATPGTGSTFVGWSGACSGTGTCAVTPTANTSVTATFNLAASSILLTVQSAGTGSGTVTSSPSGINCPQTCAAGFAKGTQVVLTAAPAAGTTFAGWSGLCTGLATCNLTLQASTTVTPTFETGTANITSLNHIIFFSQENRSLDNYFGAMRQYWADNAIPDQSFDGLPQFNPKSGEPPLYGPAPALPGCNPADPMPSDCVWDTTNLVPSYHLKTVCNENTSPSWDEAHVDWDYYDQVGNDPATNNGFVHTAAHDARTNPGTPFYDVDGIRAMGYWDGTDLNYDYFMATKFATSDRFFQPAMSRTNINREYLTAATSGGYAFPNGFDAQDTPQLTSTTIFEELDKAGISWKMYVNPDGTGCTGPSYEASCLIQSTYLENFTYAQHILQDTPQNIVPISQYFSDLANGTLPQFSEIMPASDAGLDEHGSDSDQFPENVQAGANYVSTFISGMQGLMQSSYWSDSAFIFTYDESGGMYDHVSPQPAVSPDGIPPIDLPPDSPCYSVTGPTCNFTWTGYRIPLIVVSPFAKKNYVSHTVADSTAILKFVEERFNLPALNKRDAAQIDMTEFFDFNNPPWPTPPTPPSQNLSNPCYLNKLP
jgi:phospholipase C